jgi:hypothetical protein
MLLSDSVINNLITTIGVTISTCVTSLVIIKSGRKTRRSVNDVHESVNEGRREAIIRSVPEQPDDEHSWPRSSWPLPLPPDKPK